MFSAAPQSEAELSAAGTNDQVLGQAGLGQAGRGLGGGGIEIELNTRQILIPR